MHIFEYSFIQSNSFMKRRFSDMTLWLTHIFLFSDAPYDGWIMVCGFLIAMVLVAFIIVLVAFTIR